MDPTMQTPASSFLSPRTLVLIGLVAAAVVSRLIPHPPNFSPIEASALFAGAYFADRRLALLVPLLAMALSDLVLGFHDGVPVVYACMALMALVGRGLMGRASAPRVATYGLASAVFFFVVTNFFVWATSGMYPPTWAGLGACYVAALPFLQNSLAGVAFYSIVLFGGFALLAREIPGLRAARA
jgi:hypothetical protein